MKIGLSLPLLTVSLLAPLGWSQTPAAPAAILPPAAKTPIALWPPSMARNSPPSRSNDMLKPFPPEQRKQIDANLTKAVEQIYMQQQLAEAAQKLNLEQKSPWKDQIELNRRGILARAYVAHLSDDAAKDPSEDPQKYYDAHKAEFENAKLSGIFVGFNPPGTPPTMPAPTREPKKPAHEKANDVEQKARGRWRFRCTSPLRIRASNASKGGDLGIVPINDPQVQIPAEIKAAVAKLQPGQVSEPVHIPGAFLIVKLDSREITPFDKAKADIEQKLQTERSNNVVKKETEKYALTVEDPAFFNTNGAASASTGPKIPSLQRSPPPAQPKPRALASQRILSVHPRAAGFHR